MGVPGMGVTPLPGAAKPLVRPTPPAVVGSGPGGHVRIDDLQAANQLINVLHPLPPPRTASAPAGAGWEAGWDQPLATQGDPNEGGRLRTKAGWDRPLAVAVQGDPSVPLDVSEAESDYGVDDGWEMTGVSVLTEVDDDDPFASEMERCVSHRCLSAKRKPRIDTKFFSTPLCFIKK